MVEAKAKYKTADEGLEQVIEYARILDVKNVDTYRYFGNSLYTYSLKQGIEDGFLAPYLENYSH